MTDFEKVYNFENLYRAYRKARRGKRWKGAAAKFEVNLLEALNLLSVQLQSHTYRLSPYNTFKVYEPKERVVMSNSYKDKVVQHALCDTMITKCKGVSTNFSNVEVGEALWCSGHIGVYIGGGLAVECSPAFDNDVQITAVKNMGTKSGYNARTWTKHGKLPYIEYDNAAPVQPDKPDTGAGAGGTIKAGSVVRVKQGAKTYTGGGLASFVYSRDHVVSELNGDRAVITYGGVTVAAVRVSDLTLVKE